MLPISLMKGDKVVEVMEQRPDLQLLIVVARHRKKYLGNLVLVNLLRKCNVQRSFEELIFGTRRLKALIEIIGVDVEGLKKCKTNVKSQFIVCFYHIRCTDVANARHQNIATFGVDGIVTSESLFRNKLLRFERIDVLY